MNSNIDLRDNLNSRRNINQFDYRKYNLFKMNHWLHSDHKHFRRNKLLSCHSNDSNSLIHGIIFHLTSIHKPSLGNTHLIHQVKLLLFTWLFICLISFNQFESARVYKGKKHTTNSPIYFISAPFQPNKQMNKFPPALVPHLSHSSNVQPSVYHNLAASTSEAPFGAVPRKLDYKPEGGRLPFLNVLNHSPNQPAHGLQGSIADYLLKASANPNSFVNQFNMSSPRDQSMRIKVRRKKLKNNATQNISQPIKTINVDFSILDLKKTFDSFNRPPIDRSDLSPVKSGSTNLLTSQLGSQISTNTHLSPSQPVKLIEHRMDSVKSSIEAKSSFNMANKSLNILGEIILNSLQSKFHNLPLKFLSDGQPNRVLIEKSNTPYPHKKIKVKKSQNSKIINLKLKYLNNAQPIRALINPFGISNNKKVKIGRTYIKNNLM